MQPIVHFLMSMVAGLAVGFHLENKRKKYSLILLLAIAATGIDLDHLLPMFQETGLKIFHNVFVFVLLPVALFLTFYIYERGKDSSIRQRACLLLCVMFVGHMFLDGISKSGVPLFYPFSPERFTIVELGVTIDATLFTLTSEQMIMIIWGLMILGTNFVETLTYNDVEGAEPEEYKLESYTAYTPSKNSWIPTIFSDGLFTKTHMAHHPEMYYQAEYEKGEITPNMDSTDFIFNFVDDLLIKGK